MCPIIGSISEILYVYALTNILHFVCFPVYHFNSIGWYWRDNRFEMIDQVFQKEISLSPLVKEKEMGTSAEKVMLVCSTVIALEVGKKTLSDLVTLLGMVT